TAEDGQGHEGSFSGGRGTLARVAAEPQQSRRLAVSRPKRFERHRLRCRCRSDAALPGPPLTRAVVSARSVPVASAPMPASRFVSGVSNLTDEPEGPTGSSPAKPDPGLDVLAGVPTTTG